MHIQYKKVIGAVAVAAISAITTGFLSVLKPEIFHTYLQNFQAAKTCDIAYAIRSDERGECAINLSC